jgi:chromosome segregation ATPase
MTPTTNVLDESALLIQEIENNLEKSLLKRREEIEREFQERIRREREESERQLTELEGEVARERETLKDYRGAIVEFETSRDSLHTDIKDHLDRSLAYQKDIERLTALTLEELRELADLTARLTELRDRTELKVSEIRARLKEKYGVVTEPLDTRETSDIVVNLEQELSKLKRIKALLESEDESVDRPLVLAGNAVPVPRPDLRDLEFRPVAELGQPGG